MKKFQIASLGILLIVLFSCNLVSAQFTYTIKGKVIGKESGEICIYESPRSGDLMQNIIKIKNGKFEFTANSSDMHICGIAFYDELKSRCWKSLDFIAEPGEIRVEIIANSIADSSRLMSGTQNLKLQKVHDRMRCLRSEFGKKMSLLNEEQQNILINQFKDTLISIIDSNIDNMAGLYLLTEFSEDIDNIKKISKLVNQIGKNEILKQSRDYKTVNSSITGKMNNYNRVGTKAVSFSLPDSTGNNIDVFKHFNGKIVYVHQSAPWCYNSTQLVRQLLPIYNKFNNCGLEIVTSVQEYKYQRWLSWLKTEKLPWLNVVELDNSNPNDIFYNEALFVNGNYLVDENGMVIADHLTPDKLNELLLKRFKPEKYKEYLINKYKMPEGINIIDNSNNINSLSELSKKFPGKAIFIDCWASWCRYCVEQFAYKNELDEFLNKNDIAMLYIDFDKYESKWLNAVRKNMLKGYHVRANNTLKKDLIKQQIGYSLPTYIIINSEGKLVEKRALPPGAKEKLYNQILLRLDK